MDDELRDAQDLTRDDLLAMLEHGEPVERRAAVFISGSRSSDAPGGIELVATSTVTVAGVSIARDGVTLRS